MRLNRWYKEDELTALRVEGTAVTWLRSTVGSTERWWRLTGEPPLLTLEAIALDDSTFERGVATVSAHNPNDRTELHIYEGKEFTYEAVRSEAMRVRACFERSNGHLQKCDAVLEVGSETFTIPYEAAGVWPGRPVKRYKAGSF